MCVWKSGKILRDEGNAVGKVNTVGELCIEKKMVSFKVYVLWIRTFLGVILEASSEMRCRIICHRLIKLLSEFSLCLVLQKHFSDKAAYVLVSDL